MGLGRVEDAWTKCLTDDILLCSETLVSDMRHVGSRFLSPCLVVSWQDVLGLWDGCIRSRWLRSILPTQI